MCARIAALVAAPLEIMNQGIDVESGDIGIGPQIVLSVEQTRLR
jgi:hypothetical protein